MASSNLDKARTRQATLVDAHSRIKHALVTIGAIPLDQIRREGIGCRTLFVALADLEVAEQMLAQALQ